MADDRHGSKFDDEFNDDDLFASAIEVTFYSLTRQG